MGNNTAWALRALTDQDLLARLSELTAQERGCAAEVVEHLMEVDRRDLSLDNGYSSLFEYCVSKLGYSRQAAYFRIRAARAAAEFPELLERLRSGALQLDAVVRLCPHLKDDNKEQLLAQADGKTDREIRSLVAALQIQPAPERDVIIAVSARRPDPVPTDASSTPAQGPGDQKVQIIDPPQHRFHFTGDDELFSMINRLRGLLRHKYPDGRIEAIFKEAAGELLERLDRTRRSKPGATDQTAPAPKAARRGSRLVPRAVKRRVWERDGGRCAYVAKDGRRCESHDALEYDHIVAWADGGRSDLADNIRLLCRPHNQWLGRRRFGNRREKP
jgi:hypothetical protein